MPAPKTQKRWILILMLLAARGAGAQSIIPFERLTASMKDFDGSFRDQSFECEVSPIRPALNFGFRFQSGYVMRVPMHQFTGKGHVWVALVRITPEGGDQKPVYLAARTRLPEIPETKMSLEVGGGYLLGEGRYQVAWKVVDEKGRVCRKHWSIDAKLGRGDRKVKVALPPSAVAEFSLRGAPVGNREADDAPRVKLSILMHAAPLSPRRTRLGARDRLLLMGALSSLLDRLPVSSVRLVVFNLDQQKEIYRQENFVPQSLNLVAQSLNSVELGMVDYQVLQNRGGHRDLLEDLVNAELTATTPSDMVLFMGPMARFSDKVPSDDLEKPPGAMPRFYYLQYHPNFPGPAFPDIISHAVARVKGKTLVIRTPGDFAKAIAVLERR